jgi:hypothetical protein
MGHQTMAQNLSLNYVFEPGQFARVVRAKRKERNSSTKII